MGSGLVEGSAVVCYWRGNGESSVEDDGMHVAKASAEARGMTLRPISMMNEIKEHA